MENSSLSNVSEELDTVLLEEVNNDLVKADEVAQRLSDITLPEEIKENIADLTPQITTEEKEEKPLLTREQNQSVLDSPNQQQPPQTITNSFDKMPPLTTTVLPQEKAVKIPSQQSLQIPEVPINIKENNNKSFDQISTAIKNPASSTAPINDKISEKIQFKEQQPYDFKALEEKLDAIGKNLSPTPLPDNPTTQNLTAITTTSTKQENKSPQIQQDIVATKSTKEQTIQSNPKQQLVQSAKPVVDNVQLKDSDSTAANKEPQKNNKPDISLKAIPTQSITENNMTVVKESSSEKFSITNNNVNSTTKEDQTPKTVVQVQQKQIPVMPDVTDLDKKLKKEVAHLPDPPAVFSADDLKVNTTTVLKPFNEAQHVDTDKQQFDRNGNLLSSTTVTDVTNNTQNVKNTTINEKNKDLPSWATGPIKKSNDFKSKTVAAQQEQPTAKRQPTPTDITSKSFRTIFNTINNLPPEFDAFNLKSSIERGIREVVIPTDESKGINELLNTFPSGKKTINPSQQEPSALKPPRLSFSSPYQPYSITSMKSQPNIGNLGASEKALVKVNKNLDVLSTKIQQTYQLLSTSMQALNNTATEILRTMPNLAVSTGQDLQQGSFRRKSSFTPTESRSLIGTYRNNLNLTPRGYVNNTTLPGAGIS